MAFDLSSLTSLLKGDLAAPSGKAGTVGIDIGSSSIKVVQVRTIKNIPTLETYGELQLGPYEDTDLGKNTHLTTPKVTEALMSILKEANVTSKNAAIALSYSSSFTTTITVPTTDREKIDSLIAIEARKHIPVSLTKVTLDWFPLSTDESTKTTSVLMTAIYNEALTRYDAIAQSSKLSVAAREIEIFSTIRAVLSAVTDIVVLDFGASSTRAYIVKKGVVVKTHSVPLSSVELTHALETALHTDFKNAEELKRSVGLTGASESSGIQKVLTKTLERGLREIHTVVSRTETEQGMHIESVVLSGSGALLPGLEAFVEDMFSRPVELANPFSKVTFPAFLEDTLKNVGPSFTVAVGAALRVN